MSNPNNLGSNNTGQQVAAQLGFPSNDHIFPNGIDPNTGSASTSSAGDFMAGTFADPNGLVGGLYNDIMGFTSQNREFAHEQYMTEEYETAEAKMRHARAAGINPLTAAAGIVGTNGSAGATGSATPTGLGDLASAASSIGGLPSQIAERKANAESALSVARNADRLADATVFKDAAGAAASLVGVGIPEIAAMELGLSFARNGLQGFSNAFNADNQCRLYDMELNRIDALINTENQRFADLQQLTNLHRSEADLANEKAMHENILKQYDQDKLNLSRKYEAMFANSDTMQQFMLAQEYGYDSKEYKAYMSFLKDKFYNQDLGSYTADKETAYDRAHNAGVGQYNSDPYQQQYREAYDNLDKLYDYRTEAQNLLVDLNKLHDEGKVSDTDWWNKKAEIEHNIELMNEDIKSLEKVFSKMHFSSGHPSFLQSIAGSLGIQLRINNK